MFFHLSSRLKHNFLDYEKGDTSRLFTESMKSNEAFIIAILILLLSFYHW